MKHLVNLMGTDPAHQAVSALIDRVGMASMLSIFGINIADDTGTIELASSFSATWGAFDWLSLLAGIGTLTFIVKNIIEARRAYLQLQILKREEEK